MQPTESPAPTSEAPTSLTGTNTTPNQSPAPTSEAPTSLTGTNTTPNQSPIPTSEAPTSLTGANTTPKHQVVIGFILRAIAQFFLEKIYESVKELVKDLPSSDSWFC